MTHHLRHTTTFVSAIALLAALASPSLARDAMASGPMAPDAMSADAMSADAMAPMGGDAMSTGDAMSPMGDSTMMGGGGKTIMITIENVLTGQPFSPSYFEAHAAGAAPLFKLGDTASEALAAVVSAGSMPMG